MADTKTAEAETKTAAADKDKPAEPEATEKPEAKPRDKYRRFGAREQPAPLGPPPQAIRERPRRLPFGLVKTADQAYAHLVIRVPQDVRPEDFRKPEFLEHNCAVIKSFFETNPNHIPPKLEIISHDGLWEAMYRVLYVSERECKLSQIYFIAHKMPDFIESDVYELKWRGPAVKWSVVRKDDGTMIREGFATKTEAMAFMARHLRTMAQ